ncbi:MAG: hypothetical protein RIE23_07810 [Pontimonas sp.]
MPERSLERAASNAWGGFWRRNKVAIIQLSTFTIVIASALIGISTYFDQVVDPESAISFLILLFGIIGFWLFFCVTAIFLAWISSILHRKATEKPNRIYSIGYLAFIFVTPLAALWTASTSYFGVQLLFFESDEHWYRHEAMPLVAGLLAGFLVVGFWFTLFNVVAEISKVVFLGILLFGGMTIFALSTATSVLGVGGDAAVARHMWEAIDGLEEVYESVRNQKMRQIRTLYATLDTFANYDELATRESDGDLTGAGGRGQAAVFLEDIGNALEEMEEDTRQFEIDIEGVSAAISAEIEILRESISNRGLNFGRTIEDNIQRIADFRSGISYLQSIDPVSGFVGRLDYLENANPYRRPDRNQELQEIQGELVQKIQKELKRQVGNIRSIIASRVADEEIDLPNYTHMTRAIAIFKYPEPIWLSWVISFAADFGPGLLLAFWMTAGRERVVYADTKQKNDFQK